jgi:hypothetical protein
MKCRASGADDDEDGPHSQDERVVEYRKAAITAA